MTKILKDIENLGVSTYFINVTNTLCHLYGYPTEKPLYIAQYFYALTPVKDDFFELQKYLNSYFGQTTKTFVEVVQDIISMPTEDIVQLNYIFEEAGITGNQDQKISGNSEPIIVSPKTATPKYVQLLGKITPDLAARDPRKILPVVFDRLSKDANLKMDYDELSKVFALLAQKILPNDPDADSLHRISTAVFIQNNVDPKIAKDLSDQLLIYHLAHPNATDAQLKGYLRRLLPKEKEDFNNIVTQEIYAHQEARISDPSQKNADKTPLENELVAQFTAHGLTPGEARIAAREFINSGLAVATQHLSGFIDTSDRKAPQAKAALFSEALEFLKKKNPKLANFKLDVGKYEKAFNSVAYFRDIVNNPQALLQTFAGETINKFVNSLGLKYATENFKKELISKALVKFAGTEIGKKVLTATVKKGIELIAKEGLKKGLQLALSESIIGPIIIEALFWVGEKLLKPIKDLASWAQRKIKENLPMVAAAAVALFVGLFTSLGVGGAAAAGAITYGIGSAAGGIGRVITGNPSSGMIQGTRTAGRVITIVVTETASESVTGLVAIILAIPIVLALVLFIINSGAYVVPQETFTPGKAGCWPTKGSIVQDPCGEQCSGTGCTHKPNSLNAGGLNAFDIIAPLGTPIYVTHPGIVIAMVPDGPLAHGYGNHVIVRSEDGQYQTLYGHMPYLGFVSIGQHIETGMQIGVVDDTGVSYSNHLHYELRAQVSGFTTQTNLCQTEWSINNFVPTNWKMPGTTDYDGTCYANEASAGQ